MTEARRAYGALAGVGLEIGRDLGHRRRDPADALFDGGDQSRLGIVVSIRVRESGFGVF